MKNQTDKYMVALSSVGLYSTSLGILPSQAATGLYIIGFVILIILISHKTKLNKPTKTSPSINLLLITLLISCVINLSLGYRTILLFIVILFLTPYWGGRATFTTRMMFFKSMCYASICLSIANFFCYCIGFNGKIIPNNPLDFKGLMIHPMWLSPVCGIATISSLVLSIHKRIFSKLILFAVSGLSIFTGIAAGSRSSLVATIAASCVILIAVSKNIKKAIYYVIASVLVIALLSPYVDARRMASKQEHQEAVGSTSRDELWEKRFREVEYSPIWGIGVSNSLSADGNIQTGRMESGSGWLSVISQTGIITLLVLLNCVWEALKCTRKKMHEDQDYLLAYVVFAFLCIHSLAEGYIYTPGYNLCILFWLSMGLLIESKQLWSICNLKNYDNPHPTSTIYPSLQK